MSSRAARKSEPTPNNPSLATSYWDSALAARVPAIIPLSIPETPLSTFDEEERAIIRVVRQLRTLRNNRASISCLPPELLTRIFALCAPADTPEVEYGRQDYFTYYEGEDITAETCAEVANSTPDKGKNWTPGTRHKRDAGKDLDPDDEYERAASRFVDDQLRKQYRARPLIAVTHVCRAWRALALNSAILWAVVDLSFGEHGAHEMVRRAQNAPLTFIRIMHDVDGDTDFMIPPMSALRLIIDNSPRVRALRLDGHQQALDTLLNGFPAEMPLLESLHLKKVVTDYEDSSVLFGNASTLHAPRLRHLVSHEFYRTVDWARPSLHGLESLYMVLEHARITPLSSVLDMLDGLQNLARLYIAISSFIAHSEWLSPSLRSRRVVFRRLMQLTLRSSPSECTYLLAIFAVPARTLVRLNADCVNAPGEDCTGLFALLRQWMGSREGTREHLFEPVAARIRSPQGDPSRVLVEAWPEYPGNLHICRPSTGRAEEPEPEVLVDITRTRGFGGAEAESTIAAAACELFRGTALTQVAVTAALNLGGWDSLAARSPRLRRVCAWGSTGQSLMNMLVYQALSTTEYPGDAPRANVLPHLSSLILLCIRKNRQDAELFSGWCAERARSGQPVPEVVLKLNRYSTTDIYGQWQ
ncbi:hypothetical protein FA95DRAFT_223201 [Auriscalpium vulgare]|uniref:Uncharacterized protein n=1 Tax=Auriscalpium vulgare TaxID=40419 RepID=A0ACB8RKD7_9AGAM|nr:hypothetical protein FA95DRAFT_223201 [Auriscalpium vulgare]